MSTIVILGASVGGLEVAHRILKQAPKTRPVKVILVSPNTHFYWNIAATRAIIPGQVADEKIFVEIAPGFKQYPANRFELVFGTAKHLDPEAKRVTLGVEIGEKILDYDVLILATGSHVPGDLPLKGLASTKDTIDALHAFQTRVKNAKSIVIAGGGATGVEISGELAYEYAAKKEIILIAGGTTVLPGALPSVSKVAYKDLQNLNVDVKLHTKVTKSMQLPGGHTELTLSDGQSLVTDLYIPAIGVKPNSSYVPANLLNNNGFVVVDDYLKVNGVKEVWALGDVSACEPPKFLIAQVQAAHVAKNVLLVLNGKDPLPWKGHFASSGMGIQIGKKAATGHFGSIRVPGFMVGKMRQSLFMEMVGSIVDGSAF